MLHEWRESWERVRYGITLYDMCMKNAEGIARDEWGGHCFIRALVGI